ncbi:MAG: hypothetical protein F4Z01_09955 [Gammaproteobacteria bacterium]|nr:hypothetical protein [Gammaproteobacteria bacterium]MYF37242.1 hypothetical protein [Gammaproteobacteria bacterium]
MATDELASAPLTEAEWKTMSELMVELRKIERSDLFVPVARLQLLYLLNRIEQTNEDSEDELNKLRKFARGRAYNVAAFTWPGWDDMGPISPDIQELGLSAARVTLELATQANDVTFNALWINGAHELNAKNFDSAIKFFERTRDIAEAADGRNMATTWIELCRYLVDPTKETQSNLEVAVSTLRAEDEENGDFFAKQIETARDVYTRDK